MQSFSEPRCAMAGMTGGVVGRRAEGARAVEARGEATGRGRVEHAIDRGVVEDP